MKAATDAWLATIPADKKARSDAYFEGGYWLQLWDFVLNAAIMLFFLQSRLSARMRDWASECGRKNLQTLLYFIPFFFMSYALTFPLSVYEGYFREHHYGLATQTFGPWVRDQIVELAVGTGPRCHRGDHPVRNCAALGTRWWIWARLPASCSWRSPSSLLRFTSLPFLTHTRNSKTQNPRSHPQHGPRQRHPRNRYLRGGRLASSSPGSAPTSADSEQQRISSMTIS